MTANMGDSYKLVEILCRHFEVPNGVWGMGRMVHNLGVEIGVHRGRTSALLLRAFPLLTLYMVDPWATYPPDHAYYKSGDGCARLTAENQRNNMEAAKEAVMFAGERARIVRKTSRQASVTWAWRNGGRSKLVDFVFIDGDHRFEAVAKDIENWWPRVSPGGLLCGHDYSHPRCRRGIWGVDRAVQEFSERDGVPFKVNGSIWSMVKP